MKKLFILSLFLLLSLNLKVTTLVRAEEPQALSEELVSCLKSAVGEDIFEVIKAGNRKPSDDEIKKGEVCFQKFGAPQFQGPKKPPKKGDFSPQTAACLEKTVGADFTDRMANIKSHQEAEEFKAKTKNCFGMLPSRGEGGEEKPEELQKTKDCLVTAVGQAQVDKMFTGEKPEPGSEIFNKIENSGCFKKMNFRPKDGPKENLSPETKKCIKEILGDDMTVEPSEEKRQEVGKKCFGGRGPDGQEQGPRRMSLPAEVESCLKSKVGDKYKEKPDSLSESEKRSMGECFQKNNFQPMGDQGQQNRPEINMDPTTKACIESITGNIKNQPTEDQKREMGEKCFKGPTPQQGAINNNGPQNQDPNNFNRGEPNVDGSLPPGQDNPCVKNIVGDQKKPLSQELRDKITRECFGNQSPNNQNQPQVPNNNQNPPFQPTEKKFPGGCTTEECARQYCESHQEECQPVNQEQQRFSFPFLRLFRFFR